MKINICNFPVIILYLYHIVEQPNEMLYCNLFGLQQPVQEWSGISLLQVANWLAKQLSEHFYNSLYFMNNYNFAIASIRNAVNQNLAILLDLCALNSLTHLPNGSLSTVSL